MDVRRLAAIDMHGLHGRGRRRRWVLVEFVAGVIGPLPAAAALLIFSDGAGRLLLGIWLIGIAANYVPLALHAVSLSRDGALQEELAGADLRAEAKRYFRLQVWILVPFALVLFDRRGAQRP